MRKENITLEPQPAPKSKHRRVMADLERDELETKTTMRAAAIDGFGPPSVLTLHELPVPEPAGNEVLIQLYAAGVGVWDADIRGGWWPEDAAPPSFPLVLGTDGAGLVAKTGADVHNFHPGDRVWAYEFLNRKGGFYAEYVAVDAEHVALVPKRLDLLQAGAAAVTGLTAVQGIEFHLRVRAIDTVLIFGASGAVGSLAVQFAKSHDARVIGTGRDPEARALVEQLGADFVFDPKRDDAAEQVRRFAPNGIDAVLALAGGESLQRLLTLVRPGGRVAYPNGVEPEPETPRNIELIPYDAQANPREFDRLNHAVDRAKVRVPLEGVRPLQEADKAHERIERGHAIGRIVLRIRKAKELREASK